MPDLRAGLPNPGYATRENLFSYNRGVILQASVGDDLAMAARTGLCESLA